MKKKENLEKPWREDPRVYNAISEMRLNDKSFTDRGFLGITHKYDQYEVREIWFQAIELGMHEGLRMGSIDAQRIDLYHNCKLQRQKDFLDKFYKLAEEYNCAIVYHPEEGMTVLDLNRP